MSAAEPTPPARLSSISCVWTKHHLQDYDCNQRRVMSVQDHLQDYMTAIRGEINTTCKTMTAIRRELCLNQDHLQDYDCNQGRNKHHLLPSPLHLHCNQKRVMSVYTRPPHLAFYVWFSAVFYALTLITWRKYCGRLSRPFMYTYARNNPQLTVLRSSMRGIIVRGR